MQDYIELAHRTSSNDRTNHLAKIERTHFDRVMNGFHAASKAAEYMKKQVFYGRNVPSQPPFTPASLNCPYTEADLHANLGVMGEAHEFVESDTREKVLDEGGDLLWYIAKKFRTYGITFEEAMENNIVKLKARYPERVKQHIL
jgi:hypothetical protein